MPLRVIFLLTFFIASLPICFIRPFYGIILWTIIGFLNPQSFLWGFGASFPWAWAVGVPTLIGFILFERNSRGLKTREVALILLLWAWFIITTIVSVNTPALQHHSADTWYRLTFVSKILSMTLLMIPIVRSLQRLRMLLIVVSLSFGFFVFKAFPFVIMTGGAFRVYGPDHSMVADNNDLGLALNMTLPLFFFLAQSETNKWLKLLFWTLFVECIPVIFFTWSRGALVGLVVVFLFLLTFVPFKQKLILIPIIAAGVYLALTFSPDAWRHRMDPTRQDAIDPSAQARLNVWQFSRNFAADYPIAGGGFNTFTPELFSTYGPPGQIAMAPHSVYFQLLAEHGYVGLGIYVIMLLSFFASASRLARRAKQRGDTLIRQYAKMLQFGVIGFASSGAFLGRAYFDYLFFFIACLAILKTLAAEEWAEADQEMALEEAGQEMAGIQAGAITLSEA